MATLGEVPPVRFIIIAIACVLCAACAGRDAAPIATVQPHDQVSDCAMVTAEIEANNAKVQELANERGRESRSERCSWCGRDCCVAGSVRDGLLKAQRTKTWRRCKHANNFSPT